MGQYDRCNMNEEALKTARDVLDRYLENNNKRKTPERHAILETAYQIEGHFSLEQLSRKLEQLNFRVSRATLYNTMRLFLKLRLIVRHKLLDGTKYEISYANKNHYHQICTMCGKVTEVYYPEIAKSIDEVKYKRFYKDGFSLYVYGLCSKCQTKFNRDKSNQVE